MRPACQKEGGIIGIVYQYDKRFDVTYVYESTSYYDKEKKQSRSKRKLIGRLDSETNQIVPTRKRTKVQLQEILQGSSSTDSDEVLQKLSGEIVILRAQLKQMEAQLSLSKQEKEDEHTKLVTLVSQMQKLLSDYS